MRKFNPIYLVVMLLGFLGALMIGIADFIVAGFDPSFLLTGTFWLNTICTNIGIICFILSIVLIRVDTFKRNNEDYNTSLNNINKFYHEKYSPTVFKAFCVKENLRNKTIVYTNKINRKFNKLNPTNKDLEIYYNGTEKEKLDNKYCQEMSYYSKISSPEYIKETVPKLNIKYPKISEGLIFSGYHIEKSQIDFVTTNKAKKIFIDLLPKFLISFFLTSFIAGASIDLKEGITLAAAFKLVTKLFAIVMQTYFAYTYSERYNAEVTLHDVRFRETKIKDYCLWEQVQAKQLEQKQKEVKE